MRTTKTIYPCVYSMLTDPEYTRDPTGTDKPVHHVDLDASYTQVRFLSLKSRRIHWRVLQLCSLATNEYRKARKR